jgi:hypothetical protein
VIVAFKRATLAAMFSIAAVGLTVIGLGLLVFAGFFVDAPETATIVPKFQTEAVPAR